jgi:tRNA A64-2'-O-ribosylphosphate transferase
MLLTTDRDDLPEIVDEIVEEAKELSSALAGLAISKSSAITSATVVTPALALDLGETSQPAPPVSPLAATSTVLLRVYEVEKPLKDTPAVLALGSSRAGPVILFAAPSARSHGKEYLSALTALVDHLESYGLGSDTALVMSPGSRAELDAALKLHADEQQEPTLVSDLSEFPPAQRLTQLELQSTRKTIIPLAVALRNSIPGLGGDPSVDLTADKKATAAHLHALVALWPDGNPPRAALKRVNEFLMSEARD